MTDILASLMHKGLLPLDLVAQDGIRIRAAATAPSFRRLESLLERREQAELHLKATLRRVSASSAPAPTAIVGTPMVTCEECRARRARRRRREPAARALHDHCSTVLQ